MRLLLWSISNDSHSLFARVAGWVLSTWQSPNWSGASCGRESGLVRLEWEASTASGRIRTNTRDRSRGDALAPIRAHGNSPSYHLAFCGVGGRKVDMNNREFKACRFFLSKNWILIEIFQYSMLSTFAKYRAKGSTPIPHFFFKITFLEKLGTPCTAGWTLPMCSDP